ncbi:MAG: hypothetical protein Q7V43_10645 [Myxococcales bacterium]|nr:hypothetical protein [Myxococcales bacterium]
MRNPLAFSVLILSGAACATTAPSPPPTEPTVHPAPAPAPAPVPAPSPSPAPTTASDPCRTAVCPDGTRCESSRVQLVDGDSPAPALRPRCVSIAPRPAPQPSRDPCASFICPANHHCTAPADAPYCDPD